MTSERRKVALEAARAAYRIRGVADVPLDGPCCTYDLAERIGLDVRFSDLPSMEGVYYPAKPAIIVSSLRPAGRQAFTCAHELGHHTYGHGEQFDELVEDRADRQFDPNEFIADCFAGALLMPKVAVMKGLTIRGLSVDALCPAEAYRIASWLGVGYGALLHQMNRVLGLLPSKQLDTLRNVRLPSIRRSLLGFQCKEQLIVADSFWFGRPIDAHVPDVLLLPPDVEIEGDVLNVVRRDARFCLAQAIRPGIGRVLRTGADWVHFVRVSKKNYIGLARFRHLQEVDSE